HESALVLLKVEAEAPDRSTRPLMRPALLMVMGPDPATLAAITRSAGELPTDRITPDALLFRISAPAATLPTAAELIATEGLVAEPTLMSVTLLLMVVLPVPPAADMAAPALPFELMLELALMVVVPLPLLLA